MRWASWGAMGLALLASIALAATLVAASAGLTAASRTLVRGEGTALLHAITDETRRLPPPLDDAILAATLTAHAGAGLRYVAAVGPDGAVLASAGTPVLGPVSGVQSGDLILREPYARYVQGPPHPTPPAHGRGGPPGRGEPPPPGAKPPPLPLLVLDFEPAGLARLEHVMNRAFTVGGGAALVLFVVAVAVARATVQRARDERARAREREQEERLLALGRMSAVMAHELRNPLASLKGNAQLLAEEIPTEAPARTRADRVLSEIDRLETLTHELLDFVREARLDRRPVPVEALVRRALEGVSGDRVHLALSNAEQRVLVDDARLARAIANVVQNALQAAPEYPVEVRADARGDGLVVEVRDRGPGLPAGMEEQIFEPFVTERVRGTGLGLAIARRAVEQHGGTIVGRTHEDGGAVFRITLPSCGAPPG